MSYVAAKGPQQLTTDAIATALNDHPTRVRQLVAGLVKAKLLTSIRGAGGGVVLARPPETISLNDIYNAIDEQPLLSIGLRARLRPRDDFCMVDPILSNLLADMENDLATRLSKVPLSALYKPVQ
jgi:Rrf2 family protein